MNTTLTCLNYSTIIHSCFVFAVQPGQSILQRGVGKRQRMSLRNGIIMRDVIYAE